MTQEQNKTPRVLQNIYFYVALFSTSVWLLTFGLTALVVSGSVPAAAVPVGLLDVIHGIMYYQIAHFVFGIALIVYLIITRSKGFHQTRLFKTVIGLILTPPNYLLILTALFVLAINVLN